MLCVNSNTFLVAVWNATLKGILRPHPDSAMGGKKSSLT